MALKLFIKAFAFDLISPLRTASGVIKTRQGWLIRLENELGRCGWGEISPLSLEERKLCREFLGEIGSFPARKDLEDRITIWPGSLAFGFGSALAEIDYLIGDGSTRSWLKPARAAWLLPAGQECLSFLDSLLKKFHEVQSPLTFKWKVGVEPDEEERVLLREILDRLPADARLRVDANGAWNKHTAFSWIKQFSNEFRIEWFEEPLPFHQFEDALELAQLAPVALDQSLVRTPSLRKSWPGWQVRRPALDGDPRPFLMEMESGAKYRMISTAFETGIGRRWVNHLAALQQQGPTPTAAGIAPGWRPKGPLFCDEPILVWEKA